MDMAWKWEANEHFAILGYERLSYYEDEYPFCSCFTHGRAALEITYRIIPETFCNITCPGTINAYCGGIRHQPDEEVTSFLETIYKIPLDNHTNLENGKCVFHLRLT